MYSAVPPHHQLQRRLGVLDLVLGLGIQHVSRVFSVDVQDDVAGLQVSPVRLAAPVDLLTGE